MDTEWYVLKNGVQYGPYTNVQFYEYVRTGFVQPNDLVWNQTLTNWTAAGSIPGIFNIERQPYGNYVQHAPYPKKKRKPWISILIGTAAGIFLIFVSVMVWTSVSTKGKPTAEPGVKNIEAAFKEKDVNKVMTLVHPVFKEDYKKIFEEHSGELDRIGKLMESRKLVSQGEFHAEYEVTENGKVFYMLFEKIDGKWVLASF